MKHIKYVLTGLGFLVAMSSVTSAFVFLVALLLRKIGNLLVLHHLANVFAMAIAVVVLILVAVLAIGGAHDIGKKFYEDRE